MGGLVEIQKRYVADSAFREVADILFGDGYDQVVAKANPDGADLNARKKKEKRDKTLQNVAIAGNAASAVAGPAALYSATRSARQNTGGIPRDLADAATGATRSKGPTKFGRTKVGSKIRSGVTTLNTKAGRKGKIGAAVAGGTLVGLQGVNFGTDVLSTKLLSDQKKKEKLAKGYLVAKSVKEIPENASIPNKRELTAASITTAARAGGKGAVYIKTNKGELKKLPNKIQTTREVKKSVEMDVVWEGEFSKVNADKQQVFGWASIVEVDGKPVVDLQGDYISIDEVEKSAYEYVHKSRKGGDMHLRDGDAPVHASDMIESFVVTQEKKEALGLPDSTPTGWWVGFQVNDPDVWAKVKSGERTGFSIHGRGMRTPYE